MDTDKQMTGREASYTCNDYRAEMTLLAMRRKLQAGGLSAEEASRLREEIARLEKQMGMD